MDAGPALRPRRHDQPRPLLAAHHRCIIRCTGDPPRRSPPPPHPCPRPLPRGQSPARASPRRSAPSSKRPWGRTSPQSRTRTTITRRCMCRCGWRTRSRMGIVMGIASRPSSPSTTSSGRTSPPRTPPKTLTTPRTPPPTRPLPSASRVCGGRAPIYIPSTPPSPTATSSASSSPTRTTRSPSVIGLFVRMGHAVPERRGVRWWRVGSGVCCVGRVFGVGSGEWEWEWGGRAFGGEEGRASLAGIRWRRTTGQACRRTR
ncbi:hypothetical protein B0H16DRAFT_414725 [Mycena metata]|uniref:Uncharacterized protein n=1 Tax=Mycena metata TaxID=1033252 RepID=A0AAD7JLA0_9AGAR|nr:hypothetical protein B0H16DRAFT_414725 [Mycena metata]